MCGIVGYIGKIDQQAGSLERFADILDASELRGGDATGVGWYVWGKRKNKPVPIYCLQKQAKAAPEFLKQQWVELYQQITKANPTVVLGHTRAVTRGVAGNSENNHPHVSSLGMVMTVHNGSVSNYDALKETEHLKLEGECDSEIIGELIQREYLALPESTPEAHIQAIQKAQKLLSGQFAVLAQFGHEPNVIYAWRNYNPIVMAYSERYKHILIASTEALLAHGTESDEEIAGFFTKKTTDYLIKEVPSATGVRIEMTDDGPVVTQTFPIECAVYSYSPPALPAAKNDYWVQGSFYKNLDELLPFDHIWSVDAPKVTDAILEARIGYLERYKQTNTKDEQHELEYLTYERDSRKEIIEKEKIIIDSAEGDNDQNYVAYQVYQRALTTKKQIEHIKKNKRTPKEVKDLEVAEAVIRCYNEVYSQTNP